MKQYLANKLYRVFSKELNVLVFDENHKAHDWRSKCSVKYVDTNGLKYYCFNDPFNDMNIQRLGHCETLLKQMQFGLSETELQKFWETIEKAIEGIINTMDAKGRIKNFAIITAAIQEARQRNQMIIHPDILMELAATSYIREDENPAEINRTILEEKLKQFEIDEKIRGREQNKSFFFDNPSLAQFLPQLKDFQTNWEAFIHSKTKDLNILNVVMENVSSQIMQGK